MSKIKLNICNSYLQSKTKRQLREFLNYINLTCSMLITLSTNKYRTCNKIIFFHAASLVGVKVSLSHIRSLFLML